MRFVQKRARHITAEGHAYHKDALQILGTFMNRYFHSNFSGAMRCFDKRARLEEHHEAPGAQKASMEMAVATAATLVAQPSTLLSASAEKVQSCVMSDTVVVILFVSWTDRYILPLALQPSLIYFWYSAGMSAVLIPLYKVVQSMESQSTLVKAVTNILALYP